MGDYEEDYVEPRFKYSTAELRNASCIRNQNCCIASVILLCLIVAIVVSLVLKAWMNSLEEEAKTVPTSSPEATPSTMPTMMSSLPPSIAGGRFLRQGELP